MYPAANIRYQLDNKVSLFMGPLYGTVCYLLCVTTAYRSTRVLMLRRMF